MLDEYTRIVTGDIYPLMLKGDAFFDRVEPWLKHMESRRRTASGIENHTKKGMVDCRCAKICILDALGANPIPHSD
jgi:hypothetical protein